MISEAIRVRYLRDPLPIRLGGLAADLARIASFADNPKNYEVVGSLLEEGKYFAEWTAPDASVEVQSALAQLQTSLACWQRRWLTGQPVPQMQQEAQHWSDQMLDLSGLAR